VKVDRVFRYPCRKFSSRCLFQSQGRRVDQAFTLKGYRDWKHATEAIKGVPRDADSKVLCHVERKKNRSTNSKEISILLTLNAIERNRCSFFPN